MMEEGSIFIYHPKYYDWYVRYGCKDIRSTIIKESEFRLTLIGLFAHNDFDVIYDHFRELVVSGSSFINPYMKIDYSQLEYYIEDDVVYFMLEPTLVDVWIRIHSSAYVSMFQLFQYLTYLKRVFNNDLYDKLRSFNDRSLSYSDSKVLELKCDNKHLYYALRACSSLLSDDLKSDYVVGFSNQDVIDGEGSVGYLACILGDPLKIYGDNNFCTRAFSLYQDLDASKIKNPKDFYSWESANVTFNEYYIEKSYVDLLIYDYKKIDKCNHTDLFQKQEDGPVLDRWKVEHEVNDNDKTMKYYDFREDVLEDYKVKMKEGLGLSIVSESDKKFDFTFKIHDGQLKNLFAYLDFIYVYRSYFNDVKYIYVVGCGSYSYMYVVLARLFYDKHIIFVDKLINKKFLTGFINVELIEDYLDDNYVFKEPFALLSDVMIDNASSIDLVKIMTMQAKWALNAEVFMYKFMLPWWFDKDDDRFFSIRCDSRVLLPKSGLVSSEMRIWGKRNSVIKVFDAYMLDRKISYFNRFCRFKADICYDCFRLGEILFFLDYTYPHIVVLFLESRGYSISRLINYYHNASGFYINYSRNEDMVGRNYDSSISTCLFPKFLCNIYLGCQKCLQVLRFYFNDSDLFYVVLFLNLNNMSNNFHDDVLKLYEKSEFYFLYKNFEVRNCHLLKMLVASLSDSFKNSIEKPIDWGGLRIFNKDGVFLGNQT